jgi:hypothetical protein
VAKSVPSMPSPPPKRAPDRRNRGDWCGDVSPPGDWCGDVGPPADWCESLPPAPGGPADAVSLLARVLGLGSRPRW